MLRWLLVLALLLHVAVQAQCLRGADWYVVKPNGKLTTRPAYVMTNGVLGKKVVDRAPVGATCDTKYKPTKPSGKDLWASYDSTDRVALCTKR